MRKMKKHAIILLVALIATFIICNFTEDVSKSLIKEVYKILVDVFMSEDFKSGKKIILDDSGIPMVNYGYTYGIYIGKQRNPVAISQKALYYYELYEEGNESCRQLFLNCADWLVNNSVQYDNYAILYYRFPWPIYNMTDPWRSGMAQGEAIQVLIRAHNLTNDEKYLDSAKRLLNSFFVEIENGGVTYKTSSDGWWYEEYADEGGKESRVLNGMMFTLLAIYEYYEYTEDADAKYLFDRGVLALKKSLPDYDKNGYSYYDILGNPAPPRYHKTHIRLLDSLYNITKEEVFGEYHDRWESYKDPPDPSFTIRMIQNPTIMEFSIFVVNFFVLLSILEITVFVIEKNEKIES